MLTGITPLKEITRKCQHSPVGKLLPTALYVHQSALEALDPQLQDYEQIARNCTNNSQQANIIKFCFDQRTISYLLYPDFDRDPHPALKGSIQVNLATSQVSYRDYRKSQNPPVLHRKETFVTPEYPLYEQFRELTCQEEVLGLLGNSRYIGTHQGWLRRLQHHRLEIIDHRLACPVPIANVQEISIARHKAAMVRTQISRPVKLAIETEILTPQQTFFDYGCGYGGDVERLASEGYQCAGWDPFYFPEQNITSADIVNLGYIINVIEDTKERREVLIKAWELTQKVMIVAAQVLLDDPNRGLVVYGDGVVTNRKTFQKYYQQEELKFYIDQVLGVDSIPVDLGVYFVFRDPVEAQTFRAARFYSSTHTPRIYKQQRRFEDYEELLTPLMDFVTKRGRLPVKGELEQEGEIKSEFRGFRSAFKVILQVTEEEEWDAIAEKRRQDFLVYLALSNFERRPKMKELAQEVKEDIKALFGSYKQACLLADMMLFTLRDLENIADLCATSSVGLKLKSGFFVHISALETLDPLLRLYEGCASRTFGRLESANVIKLHLNKPKVSYLLFPNFETEKHPQLQASMQVDLQDFSASYWEYAPHEAPVINYKQALIVPD